MEQLSVLIVEDEAIVALDLSDRVEEMGYVVAGIASSIAAAELIVRESRVDIILLDIQLQGGIDGIDGVARLQAVRHVPFIYLTAQADLHTFSRAKATGPSAYLLKPFDERSIQVAIEVAVYNFAQSRTAPACQLPEVNSSNDVGALPAERPALTADTILASDEHLFIKQNYRFVKLLPAEILYLRADGPYTDIVTSQKTFTLRMPLHALLTKLGVANLVRVHRSYAVNRGHVDGFSETELIIGKEVIPLGAAYREGFFSGLRAC